MLSCFIDAGANWEEVDSYLTSLRTTALAINPKNTQTLYVGTEKGGIFKSTNDGGDWEQVNSGLTTALVVVLALDPKNAQTIYAGTDGDSVFKNFCGGLGSCDALARLDHSRKSQE